MNMYADNFKYSHGVEKLLCAVSRSVISFDPNNSLHLSFDEIYISLARKSITTRLLVNHDHYAWVIDQWNRKRNTGAKPLLKSEMGLCSGLFHVIIGMALIIYDQPCHASLENYFLLSSIEYQFSNFSTYKMTRSFCDFSHDKAFPNFIIDTI